MFGLNPIELCIIGGVALLLFGSQLPKVARGVGQSVVELRKGFREAAADIDSDAKKIDQK